MEVVVPISLGAVEVKDSVFRKGPYDRDPWLLEGCGTSWGQKGEMELSKSSTNPCLDHQKLYFDNFIRMKNM